MVFQERTYAVLMVSASEKFNNATRALLPPTDYWPVDTAGSAGEARRRLLAERYDLVLVHAPLPDEFGAGLAADICRSSGAGALLMVRQDVYEDVCARVMEDGVMVLPIPTSERMMAQTLRMMCASRERLRRLEEKQVTVEEKIEEIRMMNRAKWLLIDRLGMKEDEAHRYLEKQAMDLRVPLRKAAENVILTYEEIPTRD